MFCQKCGTAIAAVATACPSCHNQVHGAPATGQALRVAGVKAAWRGALRTLRGIAADPVGRLAGAYAALGETEALRVGLVYGGLSFACLLLGGYWLFPFKDGLLELIGFGGVVKGISFAALPFITAALGSLAGRKAFGAAGAGGGGLGADCFVAGAALLPISLAMLLDGLLGFENPGAMLAVSVFAGCAGTLMLFAGYTRIGGQSERAATLVIPLVVMLALWLGKTLASSILGGGGFGAGSSQFGY